MGKKISPPAEKATCESERKIYQNINSAGEDCIPGGHMNVKNQGHKKIVKINVDILNAMCSQY